MTAVWKVLSVTSMTSILATPEWADERSDRRARGGGAGRVRRRRRDPGRAPARAHGDAPVRGDGLAVARAFRSSRGGVRRSRPRELDAGAGPSRLSVHRPGSRPDRGDGRAGDRPGGAGRRLDGGAHAAVARAHGAGEGG